MKKIDPQSWKADMPLFREKAIAYAKGEIKKAEYKGFSGRYGSYAQHDPSKNMLRLRMPAGRVTAQKLAYIAEAIRKYNVPRAHFTTCQTIQLHDMDAETTSDIMEGALDVGIVTMGGGGDFPRNTMCAPLSGVQKGEYFDVLPYAQAVGEFAMNFINAEPMPRKLKVGFSNSPENVTHATFRDMGYAARPDGKFDVYTAGGLGNNPRFGVKVAEAVEPDQLLFYLKAMWVTFRTYGDYQNRGHARTRYLQEILGGADKYKQAYLEKLKEVYASGEDLTLHVDPIVFTKTGDGSTVSDPRVIEQKQEGLYAVAWHPIGGMPTVEDLCAVSDAMSAMEQVEMRIAPYETVYIINLTGTEAKKMLELTRSTAKTVFETSVSCIGASTCQVGVRDSQALLRACVEAVRDAKIPDGALPQIHISGCPSSCGTHQTGEMGFRGAIKNKQSAFMFYLSGCDRQGEEKMGAELGTILETEIPRFLVELGQTVAASGKDYFAWKAENPDGVEKIAAPYLAE